MHKTTIPVLTALAWLVVGCAATGPDTSGPATQAAAEPAVVCREQARMGSLVRRRSCRTSAQMEADRRAAEEARSRIQSVPSSGT